ncbi:60S ribosomal protein L12 [Nosema bombycis CQ1]|uniref:60S ribosomal protein L12 n=2 Tax=Nosema bombycis TaxID=27978 RepID=R0MJ44_NOSB1|nr:60S ribosomal protein L12 [Nosema bombycis]EOB14235.1 60S ribosomal protein L12 [Nosema bombycis CQ1]|eukprot:EOB14235.1 60S ribosomal protein L12 [Nosema bombycis CQ1]
MNKGKQDSGAKYIKIQVIGGELPGPVLAQRAGSFGIQIKKVGEDIKNATAEFKGLKIVVELAIEAGKVGIELHPSTSVLLIKALKEVPRDRKKVKNIKHDGDLSLSDVIEVARKIRFKSFSKQLSGTVKEVLGTCYSIGCTVEGKTPKEVTQLINSGEIRIPVE